MLIMYSDHLHSCKPFNFLIAGHLMPVASL